MEDDSVSEPPLKKARIDPDGQKTYLISIQYEATGAYPVKILMHGVEEDDRSLIEYMETHQDKKSSEWGTNELLTIQRRVDENWWVVGSEITGLGFSTNWSKHVQHSYGSKLPYYLGRIDRCLTVTIPEWASSSSSSTEESSSSTDPSTEFSSSE